MKPTACTICGTAHWGVDHAFPGGERKVAAAERPAALRPVKAAPIAKPSGLDPRDVLIAELRARIVALEGKLAALETVAAVTAKRREANRLRMATARTVFKQPGPA